MEEGPVVDGQDEVGVELADGLAGAVKQRLGEFGQADARVGEEAPGGLGGGAGGLLGEAGQAGVVRGGGPQVLQDEGDEALLEAGLQGRQRKRDVIPKLYARPLV
jgi:hypothetical protein